MGVGPSGKERALRPLELDRAPEAGKLGEYEDRPQRGCQGWGWVVGGAGRRGLEVGVGEPAPVGGGCRGKHVWGSQAMSFT